MSPIFALPVSNMAPASKDDAGMLHYFMIQQDYIFMEGKLGGKCINKGILFGTPCDA